MLFFLGEKEALLATMRGFIKKMARNSLIEINSSQKDFLFRKVLVEEERKWKTMSSLVESLSQRIKFN